jgi:hypothetical protein
MALPSILFRVIVDAREMITLGWMLVKDSRETDNSPGAYGAGRSELLVVARYGADSPDTNEAVVVILYRCWGSEIALSAMLGVLIRRLGSETPDVLYLSLTLGTSICGLVGADTNCMSVVWDAGLIRGLEQSAGASRADGVFIDGGEGGMWFSSATRAPVWSQSRSKEAVDMVAMLEMLDW